MVKVQEWLDTKYPKNAQEIIFNNVFDGNELEFEQNSELVIADYPNLQKIETTRGRNINNITKLTINNCPQLVKVIIYCWVDNQELIINNCPNLTKLDCFLNKLTKLDLTNCPNLTKLDCSYNQLTNLKFVQQLTNLEKLDIRDNNITTGLEYLPLSLKEFKCEGEIQDELTLYGKSLIAWQQAHPELMADNLSLANLQLTEESTTPLAITATPENLLKYIKKTKPKTSNWFSNLFAINSFSYTKFALRDQHPLAWEKATPEIATSLPLRLYNFATKQVEATAGSKDIPHYLALSYVWGKDWENNQQKYGQDYETDLTKLGRKALNKAIATFNLLNKGQTKLNYIWIDNFCINQTDPAEKGQEVAQQKQYYNSATATLIAIDGELGIKGWKNDFKWAKHIIKQIITSPWFTRSWTFQEGLLSKQTIFMFDDGLVDGRELAKIWAGIQSSYALNQTTIFSTPLGWSAGATNQHSVNLSLIQALDAVKHRKQTVALDGLYAILGLLPYGHKVVAKYKSNLCSDCKKQETEQNKAIVCEHSAELRTEFPKYFQEELEQVLQELMTLAIEENPAEAISWWGERRNDESWSLPQIKEDGSTNIEGLVQIKAQPQALQITKQGIALVGSIDNSLDTKYIVIFPNSKQIVSDKEFAISVPKEDTNLPIKTAQGNSIVDENYKIFIDMINKQLIIGEELIAQYHQQLPLVQEYVREKNQSFSLVYDYDRYDCNNLTINNSLVWQIAERHYLVVDQQVQEVNIWKEIHADFANQELITAWMDNNWTYYQVLELVDKLKDKFNPQDYSFYTWARDVKKENPWNIRDNYSKLQAEYQAEQVKAQIEVPTQPFSK